MKAAVLETPGQPLRLLDVDIEAPRTGEVRVRVQHCGVCHSDLSLVDGTFPSPVPMSAAVRPREYAEHALARVPETTLTKVLHDNAAALYRLE